MIKRVLIAATILSAATPHIQVGGIRFKPEELAFGFLAVYVLFVPGIVRYRTVPFWYLAPFATVAFSTVAACLSGFYDDVVTPALTIAKWIEYGFIFLIAYSLNLDAGDFRLISRGIATVAVALTVFGLLQSGAPRAFDAAPFVGESNHIGFVCALGVLLAINEGGWLYCAAAAASVVGLMLSASRSATIAIGCGLLSFFLFTRKKVAVALLAAAAVTFLVWPWAVERLVSGIHAEVSLFVKNVERESIGQPRLIGAVNRIQNADTAVREAAISPILGLGPGVRHRIFYENQYAMWIGEMGMLGLTAFVGLVVCAYFRARQTVQIFAAVLVMYIVFALFCECFFVTRLAPLIWLVAGVSLNPSGIEFFIFRKHSVT